MSLKAPRIFVTDMSDKILRDIVEYLARSQPYLEVIVDNDETSIMEAAVREQADVVIFELGQMEIPEICNDLLNELPEAVLVGVISNGQRIVQYALHMEGTDPDEFINTIIVAKKRFLNASN